MLEQSDWKTILLSYTTIFENCRFDRLGSTGGSTFGIADFKTDQHQMKNNSYRSYGTYRHTLSCDSSLIKINETNYKEDHIINNFYGVDSSTIINFNYPGIVLNKNYATNGNESSLEDLFCEYGYAYLNATNMQYKEDNGLNLYFDDDPSIIGAWEYLPIGSTFREEVLDENNTSIWVTKEVEYDGTYVPTSEEIISGKLYLVIKSGSIEPKKIYLNNKYIPSLFLNDDKFPNNENIDNEIYNITNKTSNEDLYIINGQQPLKLCDITLYERVPCTILWDNYFVFNNIQNFLKALKERISIDNDNKIKFICYTWIVYYVNNKPVILVYDKKNNDMEMAALPWLNIVNDNVIIPNPLNKNNTGPISIGTASSGSIKVDIYLSVALVLENFTTETPEPPEPPEPPVEYTPVFLRKQEEPTVIEYTPVFLRKQEESTVIEYTPVFLRKQEDHNPDTYELNWYKYQGEEEPSTPDTYELNWYKYE